VDFYGENVSVLFLSITVTLLKHNTQQQQQQQQQHSKQGE